MWANAATSSIQDGVEGADAGSTWNRTLECVILVVILLVRKTIQVSLSYKESHFFDLSPVSLSSCSVKSSLRIPWAGGSEFLPALVMLGVVICRCATRRW